MFTEQSGIFYTYITYSINELLNFRGYEPQKRQTFLSVIKSKWWLKARWWAPQFKKHSFHLPYMILEKKYPVIHIPMNSFWDKEKINIPRKKVSCLTLCILLSKEILVKKSTFSLLEIVLKSQTYNLLST